MRAGLGTLVAAAYLLSIPAQAAPTPTEVARLKPTSRGRSSCPTVAMASGGLFIGATRHGAEGFGFGGARRTDEFEPAPVRVQGARMPRGAIARRREGETLEFAAPKGRARDPIRGAGRGLPDAELRCEGQVWGIFAHTLRGQPSLQSADSGHSRVGSRTGLKPIDL